MALSSLRLRRALTLSASFLRQRPFSAAAAAAASVQRSSPVLLSTPPSNPGSPSQTRTVGPGFAPHGAQQRRSFQSSLPSSDRRSGVVDDRKIDPDEILFEGCDYNHWLITMEFPKDPKPTPEEMVETYVQTLAKVVGSVEEAKKRMYACSTTTYVGFQAVMTEEMSEKFRGLPGVVFILPDSYIDPVNKEYGGDKYDNGVITPRPPPVQYGRQGRYGDRNRNYDRPRYDRQRDAMPMQQGNPSFDRQGPPQGDGRNFAPQQNYGQDRQGYGPPGGGNFAPERRDNFPGGRDGYQGERREPAPAYQRGFNPGQGGSFPPQERRDFPQGQQGNFPNQEPRNFPQGQEVYGGSNYGQGPSSGYGGGYRQDGSAYGQNYTGPPGQNYSGPREGQPLPQVDHRDNTQNEQRNFTYPSQTGTNQVYFSSFIVLPDFSFGLINSTDIEDSNARLRWTI
ncbi:hypothetical protein Taro_003441 [Colocasia esculenta]|uniref:MORF/ORRM1/DAG-like MORF domain-containing protein n=1 Tax=Colocasia esculenta TaxID=4460 RepID=A0A843TJF7_COLES|nr:hypothetical protein [Colocasia esculenta]